MTTDQLETTTPTDYLDRVTVSWDGDAVLIVPGVGPGPSDQRSARESLLRPLVPLDGGWIVADLGIDYREPVSMAGGFLTRTVPLWVELVYGRDVVLAAREVLAEVEAAEDSRDVRCAREVTTTWHSAPTRTAQVLRRITQGLWMRRYWPSPADGSIRPLDRTALDMELIALSRDGDTPLCLADGGVEGLRLTSMAQEVRQRAQDFIDNGADVRLQETWGLIIASCLEGLLEEAEDEGEEDEALAWEELLEGVEAQIAAEQGHVRRLAALPAASTFALAAGMSHGTFTIDWGQNAPGLLDSSAGAGSWTVSGQDPERRVTVTIRSACELARSGEVATARVYISGEALPVLIPMRATDHGYVTGEAPLAPGQEIDLVDIVSVPRPTRPVRGSARKRLMEEQHRATRWAQKRQKAMRNRSKVPRLPGKLVMGSLKVPQPWVAEFLALET